MRADDWLGSYRSLDAVGLALDRIAEHRLTRPNRLAGAVDELAAAYGGFGRDFTEFFAAALNYAAGQRGQ